MIDRKFIYILLIGCLLVCSPLLVHTVSAQPNWTYNFSTDGYQIDLVNSTYMKDWMYYLLITNKTAPWEFPVLGFSSSLVGPFYDAFKATGEGSGTIWVVVIWGLFILIVWKQSGKVTVAAMVASITAGAFAELMPESFTIWFTLLLCSAIAAGVLTFFAKE